MSPETQSKLVSTILVLLLLWALRLLVNYLIARRTEDIRVRYQWRKAISYGTMVVGIFLVGRIWLEGIQSIATYLGLVSAGIAIALQDPLKNLAGWMFILWRRPFEVGDRVQVGDIAGDVIDLRIFQFTLMEIGNWVAAEQSTGRVIHIPNGKVFTEPLANYNKGFQYIWNEIPVLLTFESNWEKAKQLFQKIADDHTLHLSKAAEERVRQAAKRYMIYYATLTPTVYTRVEDSGVLLTIRYLCLPRERRGSEQGIWEDILKVCAEHADIELAYPTIRYYTAEPIKITKE